MLKTKYDIGEIPHSEYPRPQMVRDSYICLNGKWELSVFSGGTSEDMGEITVPFSPEALNSGIRRGFTLREDQTLVYQRDFLLDEKEMKDRCLLHFGAVDSRCRVYINSKFVGAHVGGFTPFTLDITDAVNIGENIISVECIDDAEARQGARGKQSKNAGGIWYTSQSGIWQTVWLECVTKSYIGDMTVITDAKSKSVSISTDYDGEQHIRIFDGKEIIYEGDFVGETAVNYDFELWSPENPKLYDFEITCHSGDKICSYFGVRSFETGKDRNGKPRLLFNGEPYFFNGVLDQGYWSDGLLTYPSDQAAIDELTMLKDMGFNMVRKHIKLEPMRWYYHCDRLGLVVWQDFVNGGGEYSFLKMAALPFLGFKHDDGDYKYFSREAQEGREEYEYSVYETVGSLKNCVCIGAWVPFNEGWGQFDSARITELVRELDPTRIIDSTSGWYDQGVGKSELLSLHTYYTPLRVPNDPRPVVLSEFGGYSLKIDGHVFNEEKEFGYKKFKDREGYCRAVERLYLEKLMPLIEKGLCACVYTQVSDVEEEINGLVTYDRSQVKIPVARMRAINEKIYETAKKIK